MRMRTCFSSFLYFLLNIKFYVISHLGGKTIGVRALIIKEDEVLLVKHTYAKGWYTVGGGVERKETPLEAIKRELMEEVGVKLNGAPQLFGTYYNDFQKRDDYVILYLVKSFTLYPVNSPEIESWAWYKVQQLPEDTSPATKRRIEELIGKREISDRW